MRLSQFLKSGLALAMTCELFHKIFALSRPGLLVPALFFYLLSLLLLYQVWRKTGHLLGFALVSGLYGLFFLEWGLVGNTPWGNPNASQSLMFLFHAIYPAAAVVLARSEAPEMRRYWRRFCLFTLLGVLIPNAFLKFAWFIYVPMFGYLGLVPHLVGFQRNATEGTPRLAY